MFLFGHEQVPRHSVPLSAFSRPPDTVVHARAIYETSARWDSFGPPSIATNEHYVVVVGDAFPGIV